MDLKWKGKIKMKFKCSICDKVFENKDVIKIVLHDEYENKIVDVILCPLCGNEISDIVD